jgi:hypothetical protein
MKDSIRLHRKHGLAPTVPLCWLCVKEKNEIALMGFEWGRQFLAKGIPEEQHPEPPMRMVIDKEPCNNCKAHMAENIILIGARDPQGKDRSGHFMVVRPALIERMVNDPGMVADILRARVAFIAPEVAEMLIKQAQQAS